MQPLSHHWADITAAKLVATHGHKEEYTVASGITPSGRVHIGNFREVITVDLVARALISLGKKVRFIYSWDNFDTFRKVPKNVPNQDEFAQFLRKPIARIPDPWGQADSYAAGRIKIFENELRKVGISPEYRYQEFLYSQGTYAQGIRDALEKKEIIRKILDVFRSEPLGDDWLPTSVYCSKCSRDTMTYEKYNGGWDYSYQCSTCGNEETFDIRTSKNIKLAWRTDWPMRWVHEKVDFEPGGKDHSSHGGSFDTAKDICKQVWDFEAPIYLQYDFVAIKGGVGKMSSSSGELFTLTDVLEVYTPEMIRWLFANQRPNHDFSLAFDEDVIKVYEEFDRQEHVALSPCPEPPGKWPLLRRSYELSLVDGKIPKRIPFRPGFRDLCSRLQICNRDIERVLSRFYQDQLRDDEDRQYFLARAQCALNWLENHAPEGFRYQLRTTRIKQDLEPQTLLALTKLRDLVGQTSLEEIEEKELNQKIYDEIIRGLNIDPKVFFTAVYQQLINRNQGPRLPTFLKEIGQEKLLELL